LRRDAVDSPDTRERLNPQVQSSDCRQGPASAGQLTFGDASQQPVGAVIIEDTSMFRARMTAVMQRLAPGVPFGEGLKLSAEMMTTIPPEKIGMSGVEAANLILRQAMQANVLTKDQERQAAINIAKLRGLQGKREGNG
jgi:hypothetical protein